MDVGVVAVLPSPAKWETLLCTREGRRRSEAADPGVEDGADDEALVGTDSLAERLALGSAAGDVGTGTGVVTALGEGDAVEDGVELSVGAAIEAVAEGTGGGGLDGSGGGEGSELGIGEEAVCRAELGGDGAGGEESDAGDGGERRVVEGGELFDLAGEGSEVGVGGEEPGDEAADEGEEGGLARG